MHPEVTIVWIADCPARLGFDLLTGRWTAVVIYALRTGPARPVDLRRRIGGISPKVLAETLAFLERNGLVDRTRYNEAPPRVEYTLTAAGQDLLVPILALGEWTDKHGAAVLDAQDAAEVNAPT